MTAGSAQRPMPPLQATATAEPAMDSSTDWSDFEGTSSEFITACGLPDYYCVLGVRNVSTTIRHLMTLMSQKMQLSCSQRYTVSGLHRQQSMPMSTLLFQNKLDFAFIGTRRCSVRQRNCNRTKNG